MKLKHITFLVASTFALGACNQSKTASEQEAQTPQKTAYQLCRPVYWYWRTRTYLPWSDYAFRYDTSEPSEWSQ